MSSQWSDDVRTAVHSTLLLLGFDPKAAEQQGGVLIEKTSLAKGNPKVTEIILHFLFEQLDAVEARQTFDGCWPVFDKKTGRDFRGGCFKWLEKLKRNNDIPVNVAIRRSYLDEGRGPRFERLLLALCTLIFQRTLTQQFADHPVSPLGRNVAASTKPSESAKVAFASHIALQSQRFAELIRLQQPQEESWIELAKTLVGQYTDIAKPIISPVVTPPTAEALTAHRAARDRVVDTANCQHKFRVMLEDILQSRDTAVSIDGKSLSTVLPEDFGKRWRDVIIKDQINISSTGPVDIVALVKLWRLALLAIWHSLSTASASQSLPGISAGESAVLGTLQTLSSPPPLEEVKADLGLQTPRLTAYVTQAKTLKTSLAERVEQLKESIAALRSELEKSSQATTVLSITVATPKPLSLDPSLLPLEQQPALPHIDRSLLLSPTTPTIEANGSISIVLPSMSSSSASSQTTASAPFPLLLSTAVPAPVILSSPRSPKSPSVTSPLSPAGLPQTKSSGLNVELPRTRAESMDLLAKLIGDHIASNSTSSSSEHVADESSEDDLNTVSPSSSSSDDHSPNDARVQDPVAALGQEAFSRTRDLPRTPVQANPTPSPPPPPPADEAVSPSVARVRSSMKGNRTSTVSPDRKVHFAPMVQLHQIVLPSPEQPSSPNFEDEEDYDDWDEDGEDGSPNSGLYEEEEMNEEEVEEFYRQYRLQQMMRAFGGAPASSSSALGDFTFIDQANDHSEPEVQETENVFSLDWHTPSKLQSKAFTLELQDLVAPQIPIFSPQRPAQSPVTTPVKLLDFNDNLPQTPLFDDAPDGFLVPSSPGFTLKSSVNLD